MQVSTDLFSDCCCGSGHSYQNCCAPYHLGSVVPETAEQLMRSRYSAYVHKHIDYLVATTHPDKREKNLAQQVASWAEQAEFTQLEVVNRVQGGASDKLGKVEFIAHFTQQGERHRLHEISRFRRFKSRWMYFDGTFVAEE